MSFTLPDMHDVIAAWSAVSATAFIFVHPDIISDPQSLAWMFAIIGGVPVTGAVAVGAKRWMQGGSTAPLQINAPVANKEAVSPLAETPGEK